MKNSGKIEMQILMREEEKQDRNILYMSSAVKDGKILEISLSTHYYPSLARWKVKGITIENKSIELNDGI